MFRKDMDITTEFKSNNEVLVKVSDVTKDGLVITFTELSSGDVVFCDSVDFKAVENMADVLNQADIFIKDNFGGSI